MQIINGEKRIPVLNVTDSGEDEETPATTEITRNNRNHRISDYQCWKNILDRALAFIALVISSPLLVLITVIIRLDSPGDPLFRQDRVGKDGRRFLLYKFRSMYIDHDDTEYYKAIEKYVSEDVITSPHKNGDGEEGKAHDPRVTRFGRLLRKTNLDELPQFFNILKGDMSFVGPRPMIPFMVEMYEDHHKESFKIKPGLTGLWQASGRKKLSFEDMIRLDIDYIEKQSLLLDIKIILRTVFTVLRGEGS
jgi:lipopolysaccharide/colanic/teichoic acid biosynthesis glycosyltransferase